MPQRRSYGSGSLTIRNLTDGRRVYDGKWRDAHGRQIKRRVGLVRTPHQPDGLTKSQAEARLRDLIRDTTASPPLEHARTLQTAMDAWLTSLEAGGTKASSVRAYRSAMRKWFLPVLGTRSLDRIATGDIEHAMKQMRDAQLSDKSIRNYVAVISSLFNYATDKRRRWCSRNPAAEVDLPAAPTYSDIRYLTTEEAWLLIDHARAGAYHDLDRAMYLTAAMTGMRIGELQALDVRAVDFAHARIGVRRTWDRKTKTFTIPKSRRSERAIPMPDEVAGAPSSACLGTGTPTRSSRPLTRLCSRTRALGSRWGTVACMSGSGRR